jgi:hypothetical protein
VRYESACGPQRSAVTAITARKTEKGGPKAALSLSALGDNRPRRGSLAGAKVRAPRLLSQLETTVVSPSLQPDPLVDMDGVVVAGGRSAFIRLKIG